MGEEKKVTITTKIPVQLETKMKEFQKKTGINRANFVKMAILEKLERNHRRNKDD